MSGCDDRFQVDYAKGGLVTDQRVWIGEDGPELFVRASLVAAAPKCDHGEDDPCEDCEAPTTEED